MQRPSGQPNINKEEFKSFTIPLPKVDAQYALVSEMQAAHKARQGKLAEANALLAGLDGYLLTKLSLAPPKGNDQQVFASRLVQVRSTGRLNADYFHPERVFAIREQESREKVRAERLTDAANFVRESVPASVSENYVGLANVQSNTGELVASDEDAKGTCFRFAENDVLFARLRPYLNKVHRAERSGVCSTEFHVIRIRPEKEDEILPEYLATVLRSSLVLVQTRHMMTGNTHPRLANDDVVNLVVPFPELSVQQAITSEVARRREEARRLRREAEANWEVAKARFEEKLLGGAV